MYTNLCTLASNHNNGPPLRWRHNERDSVSNHQPYDCLPNRLFRRRWKKTSKLRVTGLCAGNSPGTGEFPAQMASNAEMFPFDDVIMTKGTQKAPNVPKCCHEHLSETNWLIFIIDNSHESPFVNKCTQAWSETGGTIFMIQKPKKFEAIYMHWQCNFKTRLQQEVQ